MHQVLEHHQFRHSVGSPLAGYLVADGPHHHGGTVAVALHHVGDVFGGPLFEEGTIAVGRFRTETPVIKGFNHQHHAQFIAQLHQLGSRHVVGGADGIGSHILQQLHLMAEGRTVDGSSQRTQVVVVADPLELGGYTVEEESQLGNILQFAHAETGLVAIHHLAAYLHLGAGCIESGRIGTPQRGSSDQKLLYMLLSVSYIGGFVGSYLLAVGRKDGGTNFDTLSLAGSGNLHLQPYRCLFGRDEGGGDVGSPNGDMHSIGNNQMDITVEAGTGIPARGTLIVL